MTEVRDGSRRRYFFGFQRRQRRHCSTRREKENDLGEFKGKKTMEAGSERARPMMEDRDGPSRRYIFFSRSPPRTATTLWDDTARRFCFFLSSLPPPLLSLNSWKATATVLSGHLKIRSRSISVWCDPALTIVAVEGTTPRLCQRKRGRRRREKTGRNPHCGKCCIITQTLRCRIRAHKRSVIGAPIRSSRAKCFCLPLLCCPRQSPSLAKKKKRSRRRQKATRRAHRPAESIPFPDDEPEAATMADGPL